MKAPPPCLGLPPLSFSPLIIIIIIIIIHHHHYYHHHHHHNHHHHHCTVNIIHHHPSSSSPDGAADGVDPRPQEAQAVGELGGHRQQSVGHVGAQDILTFISKIKVNRWEIISIHWTMLESA